MREDTFKMISTMLYGVEPGEEELLKARLEEAKSLLTIGDEVTIKFTSYTGEVVGFNERLGGIYSGARYPVFVKITKTGPEFERALNQTFEYGTEQLEKL